MVVAASGKQRTGKDLGKFHLYSETEFLFYKGLEQSIDCSWVSGWLQKVEWYSWNGYILQNRMVVQVIPLGQSGHLLVRDARPNQGKTWWWKEWQQHSCDNQKRYLIVKNKYKDLRKNISQKNKGLIQCNPLSFHNYLS